MTTMLTEAADASAELLTTARPREVMTPPVARGDTAALRAVIYARISPTPSLTISENLDQQRSLCEELAARRGWQVVNVVVDREVSASKGERPGWLRVVEMVRTGEVAVVIGRHPDRLYRQMRDLEDLVDLAEQTGVTLATVEGDYDLSTPTGKMIARILGSTARAEMDMKAERQKLGHQRRASEGRPWWNSRPFGFERDGTHREDEVALLRQAYRDVLNGHTLFSVATGWNDAGHTTPKGNPWRSSNLRTVLLNPRNIALHMHRGVETGSEAAWDPIVSVELFSAVGRILLAPDRRAPNNDGKRKGLLTNVARCGACRSTVGLTKSRPNKVGERYGKYQCRGCRGMTIPSHDADLLVIHAVVVQALDREWARTLVPSVTNEMRASEAELRAERTALIQRTADLAEMFAEGAIDAPALRAGSDRATARLKEVNAALSALVLGDAYDFEFTSWDIEYLADQLTTMYEGNEYDRLRVIVASAVREIEFLPRGRGARTVDPATAIRVTFADGSVWPRPLAS